MKTYSFWSKTTGQEVFTEKKANSIAEVREWAKREGVTITSRILRKK